MADAREPLPEIAARIETAFAESVGGDRFRLWFPPNARFYWLGDKLAVACRNTHFRDWAQEKFGDALAAAVETTVGPAHVEFVADPEAFAAGHGKLFVDDPAPPAPPKPRPKPEVKPARRWKTFHEFVPGVCNRVAHAAALGAAEEPGSGPNPVVLHGPVGTGKTHLLESVYARLRQSDPGCRPMFVSGEEFATRFGHAIRFGKMSGFRAAFRGASALLFDDLHFLETKPGNQEELLHTLDALVSAGRPVIITTDCHPRLADKLLPELADRLLAGSVCSLQPPDDETRIAVLRQKAACSNPPVPDDVLRYLARHLTGNVRELEGAVHTLRHVAKVTGQSVTAGLAKEALGELLRHAVRAVGLADIDAAVCGVVGVPAGTLQAKKRTWAVTHPRMAAIYLARKLTAATYGEIAKYFGVKQHSTAVAAEKTVRGWLKDGAVLAIGERRWPAEDLIARVERELSR